MNTPTSSLPHSASPSALLPHAAISFRAGVWSVLAGMSLVIPLSLLVAALHLPASDAAMQHVSAARLAPLGSHPWLFAAHALLIAPLWEEGVYRGLILHMLRRYTPLWFAIAVPTFIFAGTHLPFSYQNAAQAAFVGLASTWLVCRSRSLLPSILFHSGVNLAALFVLRPLVLEQGWTSLHQVPLPWLVLFIGGSCAGVVAAARILRGEFRRGAPVLAATPLLPLPTA